jgi:hypothetical protein
MVERFPPPPRTATMMAQRRRRRVVMFAVAGIAAGLLVGGALAWRLGGGSDKSASAAEPSPSAAPPAPTATAPSGVAAAPEDDDVIQMPPMELDRDDAPSSDTPGARPPMRRATRPPAKATARKPDPKPEPKPESTISRAEVEGRFRALSSEYREFKKNYGARLESEWAALLHFAQNEAKQNDDKLRLLDKRIGHFRGKMAKERQ